MKYDVFISYSRKDSVIADRICRAFEQVGISYFIDQQGLNRGYEFPDQLAKAILDSQIVLFLASKNSYESKFTNAELTFAFNEKPKNSILPYIIDGTSMPPSLRLTFSCINWCTIKSHPIETVLLDDIFHLLKRKRPNRPSGNNIQRNIETRINQHSDREYCPEKLFSFSGRVSRLQFILNTVFVVLLAIGISVGFWCSDLYWSLFVDSSVTIQILIILLFVLGALLLIWILLAAEAKRSYDIGKPSFMAMVKSFFKEKFTAISIYLVLVLPILFLVDCFHLIFMKDDYWSKNKL